MIFIIYHAIITIITITITITITIAITITIRMMCIWYESYTHLFATTLVASQLQGPLSP